MHDISYMQIALVDWQAGELATGQSIEDASIERSAVAPFRLSPIRYPLSAIRFSPDASQSASVEPCSHLQESARLHVPTDNVGFEPGGEQQMDLSTHIRSTTVTVCTLLSVLAWRPAWPAELSGSIQFGDENFSVEVRSPGQTLPLAARGCNNFDLALASGAPRSTLLLQDVNGKHVGTIGPNKTLESRTCGAERYSTELIFSNPTSTKWTPQADESRGTKKVKYTAALSPTEIRFDPPVALTAFDQNTRVRPIKIPAVAKVTLQGEASLLYSSDTLHFLTAGGTIRRHGGFISGDTFAMMSGSKRITLPDMGHGSEITFDPLPDHGTMLSLYYPLSGPHVLALFQDEAQQLPTSVSSFRVDGKQLLEPELTVERSDPLLLERGPFDFILGREQLATSSLEIRLGTRGTEVRDVRISSVDANVLSLAKTPEGPYESVVSYPTVAGSVPLVVHVRARIPRAWETGEHTAAINVTSEGGLERRIPLSVRVVDQYRTARIGFFALLAVIVIGLAIRTLVKRRRLESQQASVRARFIQQHYDEYARARERIEVLLAGELDPSEVTAVLNDFAARQLHTALSMPQWSAIVELSKQGKAREALDSLDRALARFEG
jgi:hypothetical protein